MKQTKVKGLKDEQRNTKHKVIVLHIMKNYLHSYLGSFPLFKLFVVFFLSDLILYNAFG